MKIKTFGYRKGVSPLDSLDRAFESLGHQIITDEKGECDVIFDLTGFPDEAIEYSKTHPQAIKIFNLLNADINNPNWGDGRNLKEQLLQADIVTTPSESTRKDILNRVGINSTVIYFPIKKIWKTNILKNIDFLYVGRIFNNEKRFDLVVKTVFELGHPTGRLLVVGPENPNLNSIVGYYSGCVDDDKLNIVYNQSNILLCPCKHEGSLAMLEAVLADCIPIVSTDNEWVYEFNMLELSCNPDVESMIAKINDVAQNYQKYLRKLDELKPLIRARFEIEHVAQRILNLYQMIHDSKSKSS